MGQFRGQLMAIYTIGMKFCVHFQVGNVYCVNEN